MSESPIELADHADTEAVENIRALHGWALLTARDANSPEEAGHKLAAAKALGEALHLIDTDWAPFDNEAAAHYAQVSRSVSRADSMVRESNDTREVGLQ